jgi:hypothetical protein
MRGREREREGERIRQEDSDSGGHGARAAAETRAQRTPGSSSRRAWGPCLNRPAGGICSDRTYDGRSPAAAAAAAGDAADDQGFAVAAGLRQQPGACIRSRSICCISSCCSRGKLQASLQTVRSDAAARLQAGACQGHAQHEHVAVDVACWCALNCCEQSS